MLKFGELTLCNFLSVGAVPQAIDLSAAGLTLVLGENRDVGGAANSRNGVGKTTILQALVYALYGKPLTGISPNNLVNDINRKAMLVTLEFQHDTRHYRIERGRQPNVLRFFVGGARLAETDAAEGANRHTQAEIERVLGIGWSLFAFVVGLNSYAKPFFRMSAAEQRAIVEQLLGITLLSERAAALKLSADRTREDLRLEDAKLAAKQESNQRIETAIGQLKADQARWLSNHATVLARLQAQLDTLAALDPDAELVRFAAIDTWQRAAHQAQAELATAERAHQAERAAGAGWHAEATRLAAALAERSDPQLARLAAEEQRYLAEAARVDTTEPARLRRDADQRLAAAAREDQAATMTGAELATIRAALAEPERHICMTCGQGLQGTSHLATVLAGLRDQAAAAETATGWHLARADQLRQEAAELRTSAEARAANATACQAAARERAALVRAERDAAHQAAAARRTELVARQAALDAHLAEHRQRLATAASAVAAARAALDQLGPCPQAGFASREALWAHCRAREAVVAELAAHRRQSDPHAANITRLSATLDPLCRDARDALALDVRHHEFLQRLLTHRESYVRQAIVERNLAALNGRLAHYLDALRLPHQVRFLPDLTAEVSRMGRGYDYDQLCRGEANRVDLALAWGFRDLWESGNSAIGLLWIDEMLDMGIDDCGAELAIAVLGRMAGARRSVFLVSHKESLIGRVDRILRVCLEDGFTHFEPDVAP